VRQAQQRQALRGRPRAAFGQVAIAAQMAQHVKDGTGHFTAVAHA